MILHVFFKTAKGNPCGRFVVNELTAKAVYKKIDNLMGEFRAKCVEVCDSGGTPLFNYNRDKKLIK